MIMVSASCLCEKRSIIYLNSWCTYTMSHQQDTGKSSSPSYFSEIRSHDWKGEKQVKAKIRFKNSSKLDLSPEPVKTHTGCGCCFFFYVGFRPTSAVCLAVSRLIKVRLSYFMELFGLSGTTASLFPLKDATISIPESYGIIWQTALLCNPPSSGKFCLSKGLQEQLFFCCR